jgi:hypothetical protein
MAINIKSDLPRESSAIGTNLEATERFAAMWSTTAAMAEILEVSAGDIISYCIAAKDLTPLQEAINTAFADREAAGTKDAKKAISARWNSLSKQFHMAADRQEHRLTFPNITKLAGDLTLIPVAEARETAKAEAEATRQRTAAALAAHQQKQELDKLDALRSLTAADIADDVKEKCEISGVKLADVVAELATLFSPEELADWFNVVQIRHLELSSENQPELADVA